jgi:hypothetical protein
MQVGNECPLCGVVTAVFITVTALALVWFFGKILEAI